jgi:hypothetical protein
VMLFENSDDTLNGSYGQSATSDEEKRTMSNDSRWKGSLMFSVHSSVERESVYMSNAFKMASLQSRLKCLELELRRIEQLTNLQFQKEESIR